MLPLARLAPAAARAAALVRRGLPSPLDLDRLLRRLGLTLTEITKPRPRREGCLVLTDSGYEVRLYTDASQPLRLERERFTVAHEIGHFWLEQRFGIRPRGEAEYWRLEAVCDTFARHLLVGEADVGGIVLRPPQTALQLLRTIERTARELGVCPATLSHRVAGRLHQTLFCSVDRSREDYRSADLSSWWAVSSSPARPPVARRAIDDIVAAALSAPRQRWPVGVHVPDADVAVLARVPQVFVVARFDRAVRKSAVTDLPSHESLSLFA